MPRQLALLLCIGFIVWLFRADMKWRRLSSGALWIPGIWLAIIGSRPLAYWLGGVTEAGDRSVEGNPVNLLVQGILMASSLYVLQRRAFDWGAFVRDNKALLVIYLYFALSAIWAYHPFPALKRTLRDFGTVLTVLVILTESDPLVAVRTLFVRVSFLLFPLSVLLIKYFPEYGRMYSKSWELMFTGVTTHKNTLGMVVMVFGLVLVLDMMEWRRIGDQLARKSVRRLHYILIVMGLWLLWMSNSKTSLLCTMLGCLVLWGSRYLQRMRSASGIASVCITIVLGAAFVELGFGVSGALAEALGRERNLTGRTDIWAMVNEQPINPIIGCGFMAFWDSPLGGDYRERSETELVSAHNGYIESYLDGGAAGLVMLALLLFAGGRRIVLGLLTQSVFSRASLVFFAVTIVHNWSESSYFRVCPLWFVFLLSVINRSDLEQSLRLVRSRWPQDDVSEVVRAT